MDREGPRVGGGDRRQEAQAGPFGEGPPHVGARQDGEGGDCAEPPHRPGHVGDLGPALVPPGLQPVLEGPAELVGLGGDVGDVAPHEEEVPGLDDVRPPREEGGVHDEDGGHGEADDLRTLQAGVVDGGTRHPPPGDGAQPPPEGGGAPPPPSGRRRRRGGRGRGGLSGIGRGCRCGSTTGMGPGTTIPGSM